MIDAGMPWLLSKLIDAGAGKMAIIVGGGPSAPSDLKKIPHAGQAVIISANAHAFKLGLKVDYIWCKDHVRVFPGWRMKGRPREYMEMELRKYGRPIVGPNYWCDYRAIGWPLTGFNSGQQALAFACLLGCAPIIPIGMDCFDGATYFHDKDAANISKGRRPGYWVSRMQRLALELPRTPIRGVSGLAASVFGEYRPDRHPLPGPVPPRLLRYVNMTTIWVRARREFQDSREKFAIIPKDYVLPSNKDESDRLIKTGIAERVELFDS